MKGKRNRQIRITSFNVNDMINIGLSSPKENGSECSQQQTWKLVQIIANRNVYSDLVFDFQFTCKLVYFLELDSKCGKKEYVWKIGSTQLKKYSKIRFCIVWVVGCFWINGFNHEWWLLRLFSNLFLCSATI